MVNFGNDLGGGNPNNDTFGKPDFAALNLNGNNLVDAINNAPAPNNVNDAFAPPSNMTFGGDSNISSAPDISQLSSGTSLVSFFEQL